MIDLSCDELIFSSVECIGVHYRSAAAPPRRWNDWLMRACEDCTTRTTATCWWVDAGNHSAFIASGTMFLKNGNAANHGLADSRMSVQWRVRVMQ